MKTKLILTLPLFAFFACKNGDKHEQTVSFDTEKQKLSYALGAEFAMPIVQAGEEANILDFNALVKGFENSLDDKNYEDCQKTVLDAFGMNFSSPDSTKKIEGSECFGKLNGSKFFQMMTEIEQIKNIDLEYVKFGYKDAIFKKDTILSQGEKASLITKFQTEVQTVQMKKMQDMDKPFMDLAKSKANTNVIDGGIVIETIKKGNGGSPTVMDEVVAHYILTNAMGDTIESSYKRGEPLTISLQSVIPGWTMSFPHLKKGGEYRLYIPSELAYGKGALCFFVELIDYKSK